MPERTKGTNGLVMKGGLDVLEKQAREGSIK